MQKNVFDGELQSCCNELETGFHHNGKCETDDRDADIHTVCAKVT